MPTAVQMVRDLDAAGRSLERLRRYGKRNTIHLPFQPPFVILSDPATSRSCSQPHPTSCIPARARASSSHWSGATRLILLDEAAHLEQRNLMLPAFHGERMKRLTGLMSELAEREVTSWPRERPVALHPRLQRVTLEIILRVVFGLEEGPKLDDLRELLTGVSPSPRIPSRWCRRCSGGGLVRRYAALRGSAARLRRADLLAHRAAAGRAGGRRGRSRRDDVLAMLLARAMRTARRCPSRSCATN